MAIIVTSICTSKQLINKINTAIEDLQIRTWLKDSDGDYTINRDQWRNEAWLHPQCDDKNEHILRFGIIGPKNVFLTKTLYGIYHGRFVATLLSHFDTDIDKIEVSPLLIQGVDFCKNE